MKITQFFSPLGQKQKEGTGEEIGGKKHKSRKTDKQKKQDDTVSKMEQKTIVKLCNLSTYILSETEIDLLSKGLNFCPTSQFN